MNDVMEQTALLSPMVKRELESLCRGLGGHPVADSLRNKLQYLDPAVLAQINEENEE